MPALSWQLALATLLLVCTFHGGAARDCKHEIEIEGIMFEAAEHCEALFDKNKGVTVQPTVSARRKGLGLRTDSVRALNEFCRCLQEDGNKNNYKSVEKLCVDVEKSCRKSKSTWDNAKKTCVRALPGPHATGDYLRCRASCVASLLKEAGAESDPFLPVETILTCIDGCCSVMQDGDLISPCLEAGRFYKGRAVGKTDEIKLESGKLVMKAAKEDPEHLTPEQLAPKLAKFAMNLQELKKLLPDQLETTTGVGKLPDEGKFKAFQETPDPRQGSSLKANRGQGPEMGLQEMKLKALLLPPPDQLETLNGVGKLPNERKFKAFQETPDPQRGRSVQAHRAQGPEMGLVDLIAKEPPRDKASMQVFQETVEPMRPQKLTAVLQKGKAVGQIMKLELFPSEPFKMVSFESNAGIIETGKAIEAVADSLDVRLTDLKVKAKAEAEKEKHSMAIATTNLMIQNPETIEPDLSKHDTLRLLTLVLVPPAPSPTPSPYHMRTFENVPELMKRTEQLKEARLPSFILNTLAPMVLAPKDFCGTWKVRMKELGTSNPCKKNLYKRNQYRGDEFECVGHCRTAKCCYSEEEDQREKQEGTCAAWYNKHSETKKFAVKGNLCGGSATMAPGETPCEDCVRSKLWKRGTMLTWAPQKVKESCCLPKGPAPTKDCKQIDVEADCKATGTRCTWTFYPLAARGYCSPPDGHHAAEMGAPGEPQIPSGYTPRASDPDPHPDFNFWNTNQFGVDEDEHKQTCECPSLMQLKEEKRLSEEELKYYRGAGRVVSGRFVQPKPQGVYPNCQCVCDNQCEEPRRRVSPDHKTCMCVEEKRKVDCVMTKWTSWSRCSKPCGTGTQTRTRTIRTQPQNGGKACPATSARQNCRTQPCAGAPAPRQMRGHAQQPLGPDPSPPAVPEPWQRPLTSENGGRPEQSPPSDVDKRHLRGNGGSAKPTCADLKDAARPCCLLSNGTCRPQWQGATKSKCESNNTREWCPDGDGGQDSDAYIPSSTSASTNAESSPKRRLLYTKFRGRDVKSPMESFYFGQKVKATDLYGREQTGVLRFVGDIHKPPGLWVGIECDHTSCPDKLSAKIQRGEHLISTNPNRALFVHPSKVEALNKMAGVAADRSMEKEFDPDSHDLFTYMFCGRRHSASGRGNFVGGKRNELPKGPECSNGHGVCKCPQEVKL